MVQIVDGDGFVQESTQKIAVLHDASQAVLSTFDVDEVLNNILTIIHP